MPSPGLVLPQIEPPTVCLHQADPFFAPTTPQAAPPGFPSRPHQGSTAHGQVRCALCGCVVVCVFLLVPLMPAVSLAWAGVSLAF